MKISFTTCEIFQSYSHNESPSHIFLFWKPHFRFMEGNKNTNKYNNKEMPIKYSQLN